MGDSSVRRLDTELRDAMLRNLELIEKRIPPRTRFRIMLRDHGAAQTWRRLRKSPTSGFTALKENGLLHLSLEALISDNPQYHKLFSPDELKEMRQSLAAFGYDNPQ